MIIDRWIRQNRFKIIWLVTLVVLGTADTVLAAGKGWVMTDTARVMNFTVLVVLLFLALRKPVSQALNGRITGIKEELDELEAKKAEAEKKLADYDTQIASLEGEAKKIVAEYIQQGEDAKKRILEESRKAADKLEEQARKNIEHEFQSVKNELQGEILEKALIRAEEMVKGKITEDDQNRLVDEYLEKVVAQ
jgi:F-type H+-transporting ATPase subunit b